MTVIDFIGTCLSLAFIVFVVRGLWIDARKPFVVTFDYRLPGITTRSVPDDTKDGEADAKGPKGERRPADVIGAAINNP